MGCSNGERANVRMESGRMSDWRVGGSMFPDQPGRDPDHGMDQNDYNIPGKLSLAREPH